MKILVTGSNGQVGWELVRQGKKQGLQIAGLNHQQLDITDSQMVQSLFDQNDFSLVVNAAAYTSVDQAESEREVAFAVNRDGPANLASACTKAGIPLIHISTDYVFDGRKKIPYSEYDRVSPLGAYGESKFAGESVLKGRSDRYIILRTAWVYGVHGNNFVKTMLKLGQKNEILRVVNDQFGCPTYAADVADVILKIALIIRDKTNIDWGTYHYCGHGVTSWCGFAESIFEIARAYRELKVKRVEPISSSEYHTVAQRPAYSVLDCSLIKSKFQIRPIAWRVSLADVLKKILINKIFS